MADCTPEIYLPASYKGVAFECLSADSEHGRRGAEGEFPFGEKTAYADLGRKIEKYTLKGRYNGSGHVALAANLIAACRSVGPGVLIHPTRGILTVACTSLKVSNEFIAGEGESTFDLEFVEASDFSVGLSGVPLIAGISNIVNSVLGSFQSAYNFLSVPFYEKTQVSDTVSSALNTLQNEFIKTLPSTPDATAWTTNASLVGAATQSTIQSATRISTGIDFGFSSIDAYAKSPSVAYDSFRRIASKFSQSSKLQRYSGLDQEAIYSTMRLMAVAYMFRNAQQIVSKTLDEALVRMDAVVKVLLEEEAIALSKCYDSLYIDLRTFQGAVQRTLTNTAYRLPPVIMYDFHGGVPSLVAAHEIYGDAKRFSELEDRNLFYMPYALGPKIMAIGV